MKRRTLKQFRSKCKSQDHHHVYVVLLDPAVGKIRKVRAANPDRNRKKPCVYVGMTGLMPEERLANHKAGTKAASLVTRYGLIAWESKTAVVAAIQIAAAPKTLWRCASMLRSSPISRLT